MAGAHLRIAIEVFIEEAVRVVDDAPAMTRCRDGFRRFVDMARSLYGTAGTTLIKHGDDKAIGRGFWLFIFQNFTNLREEIDHAAFRSDASCEMPP